MLLRQALFIAALVAMASARPKWHQLDGYTFERYVKDFGKSHKPGSMEWVKRQALFEAQMQEVQQHNAGDYTWKKGINKFSDWTPEEKASLHGNRIEMKQHANSKPEKIHVRSLLTLPHSVDWSTAEPRVITSIKDQGPCGSCWAHAATEAIETAVAQATGDLYVLSQQQIASCTPNPNQCGGTGGCGGGIAELAIDYISTIGIQEEWTYPYTSYFGNNSKCLALGLNVAANVSGYTSIPSNDGDAVLDALATIGPVAVSVDASEWSNYETGVFSNCSYAKNISMDHAVQAVGFGHDDDLGVDYWLIRNSWSAGWGESGFMKLMRHKVHECGWNVKPQNGDGCKGQTAPQWACGTCGVAFDALYANYAPLQSQQN